MWILLFTGLGTGLVFKNLLRSHVCLPAKAKLYLYCGEWHQCFLGHWLYKPVCLHHPPKPTGSLKGWIMLRISVKSPREHDASLDKLNTHRCSVLFFFFFTSCHNYTISSLWAKCFLKQQQSLNDSLEKSWTNHLVWSTASPRSQMTIHQHFVPAQSQQFTLGHPQCLDLIISVCPIWEEPDSSVKLCHGRVLDLISCGISHQNCLAAERLVLIVFWHDCVCKRRGPSAPVRWMRVGQN